MPFIINPKKKHWYQLVLDNNVSSIQVLYLGYLKLMEQPKEEENNSERPTFCLVLLLKFHT